MTLQDWFLAALLFITGLVIGGTIYVTTFKPVYAPEDIDNSEELAAEFSIVAEQYGGVRRAGSIAPSYRVLADGSYSYVRGGTGEFATEAQEGFLPRGLTQLLLREATVVVMQDASGVVEKTDCRSFVDGIDYRYRIVRDNVEYQLDTCATAFAYDADLAVALEDVWEYLADPQTYRPPSVGAPADRAKDFLRSRLSPYEDDE